MQRDLYYVHSIIESQEYIESGQSREQSMENIINIVVLIKENIDDIYDIDSKIYTAKLSVTLIYSWVEIKHIQEFLPVK